MDNIPLSNVSTKEPRSPEYTSLMKAAPPKKTKLKRRVVPREREQRKRLKDRKEAKQLLKKIEDLNKQIAFESGLQDKVDGPQVIPDWKGISQKHALYVRWSVNSFY